MQTDSSAPRQLSQPLSVRRYGRNTFLVRSEVVKKEHWYLVEIPNPEHPHGQCDCLDHSIRITAPINRGEEPEKWMCKHCRRVLSVLDGIRNALEQHGLEMDPAILIPLG